MSRLERIGKSFNPQLCDTRPPFCSFQGAEAEAKAKAEAEALYQREP